MAEENTQVQQAQVEDLAGSKVAGAPDIGELLLSTQMYEYAPFERGQLWYVGFGIALGLLGLLFLWLEGIGAFSFVLGLLVVYGAYVYAHYGDDHQKQSTLAFTTKGILAGARFYNYEVFGEFSIIPHETYTHVRFYAKSNYTTGVDAYLLPGQDVAPIRMQLQNLQEPLQEREDEKENPVQTLLRKLKL